MLLVIVTNKQANAKFINTLPFQHIYFHMRITVVIEEALCLLESSSPITIRIDAILSNVKSPVVTCTDDATNKGIPLQSVTVSATSEILNTTLMPVGSPVGNFTCLITGEDGSESASCTLIGN